MHLIAQPTLEQMVHEMAAMAHYHDYGVLMLQQVANMTQLQTTVTTRSFDDAAEMAIVSNCCYDST